MIVSDERTTAPLPPAQSRSTFVPVVYADNVLNVSVAEHVVKIYLVRDDPSPTAPDLVVQRAPIAELIMPIDGFIRASVFFEITLNEMVSRGLFQKEEVDRLRNAVMASSPFAGGH
jgi:hypothetical protein